MARGGIQLRGSGLKKLQGLTQRLSNISEVLIKIATAQSEAGLELVKDGFAKEESPYGQRWKKRKRETKATRGRKVLAGKTSRLKDGWHVASVRSNGWRLQASVDYAVIQQKRKPRRAMVPSTGRFPKNWRRPMTEAASDAITNFMVGK